jgi:hypothetical protein
MKQARNFTLPNSLFSFFHFPKISETSVIELLKKTPRIRSVELQNLSTTEKVVGVIAKKCQLLRRLVLVSTRLNEQCLIELSSLPSLTQLTLKECQGATTAGLAFLFSNELLNDFDLQKIVVLNSMVAKVQTHFDAAVLLFQESRKESHPLRPHSRRLFLRASVSRFQRAIQMTQCTLDEVIKAVFSSSFSPSLLLSTSNMSSSTTQLPSVPLPSSSPISASGSTPSSPSLVRSNSTPFPASVSCCTMQQLYFLQLWPELVGHVSQCFKETTTLSWKNGGDNFVGNEELVNMFENNKITNIFITASNPSTSFLQKMSHNWHGLTSLELRSCDAITDR